MKDSSAHHASLADTLDCVLPHASARLIPETAGTALRSVAKALPPIARGLLECRLGAPGAVDLSIGALNTQRDKTLIADYFRQIDDGAPAWTRTMAFVDRWLAEEEDDPGSRYAWFEFDIPGPGPCPAPSIFVSVRGTGQDRCWDDALARLTPRAVTESRLWPNRLPDGARLEFIGVMVPRGSEAIRLNLSFPSARAAWAWIDAYGAAPDPDARPLFTALFEAGSTIVTVDAEDGRLGPRIGLECRPGKSAEAERILALCQSHGLCDNSAREAVTSWTGLSTAFDQDHAYPAHLVLEELAAPEKRPGALVREVNHVKVSFTGAAVEPAKLYLSFTHAFETPETATTESP